jgi:hypothetical protein
MQITSARHITGLAAAAVLGAALVGCGAPAVSDGGSGAEPVIQRDVEQLETRAQQYAGDPWEKRFRAQFWADQHVHDAWNRCHLGENAPRPHGCDGTSLTPRR